MTISRKQFELANPFVLAKAKKMFRTRDFAGMEQCDLEQQLWCRLTQESPRFDPSRGRWEAFVIAVIEGECASALRAIYAEQRTPLREEYSLNEDVLDLEGQLVERHELTPEVAWTTRPERDLQMDLSGVLSRLTDEQRAVAVALGLGTTNSASTETELSRRNVARTIEELRQIFEDAGLRAYL